MPLVPNIFIVSIMPYWLGISRLPKALKDQGFNVICLCDSKSYLAKSQFIDRLYVYNSMSQFRTQLIKIMKSNEIDFIIPGCDKTVSYFNDIIKRKRISFFLLAKLKKLIIKSCNTKDAYEILSNKSKLQNLAVSLNILTPRNIICNTKSDLLQNITTRNFPIVLKKDFGVAGDGVRICNNANEVELAFNDLKSNLYSPSLGYKLKVITSNLLALPVDSKNSGLSVQDYIEGIPVMHGVFASRGKVLSSITLLKITCYPTKTSPSSVVQVIKHKTISESCERIIAKTNVSGFLSFDFILDDKNQAYLLECNPRPTPVSHLSHLCGGNLCAMLKVHFGIETEEINPYPELQYEYIALFPNELKRDPESKFLKEGYHDIPFEDREILKSLNEELQDLNLPTFEENNP